MVKKKLMKPINKKDLLAKIGHVVVLRGGVSSEREISLASGAAVFAGLQRLGAQVSEIDVTHNVIERLVELKPDLAFIALHGQNGEDGVIQGLLEVMGISCTGSGVLSSALAMNKIVSKQVWRQRELKTPDYELLNAHSDWGKVIEKLHKVVVKPVSGGSSLGISMTRSSTELKSYYEEALDYGSEVFAEQCIEGVEFSTGVLGDEIFPTLQLETSRQFFDYEAKYIDSNTKIICPPKLSGNELDELEDLVSQAYKSLKCKGLARVDVMRESGGDFYLLELNTIPGLTEHSFVPSAMKAVGVDYDDMLLKILQNEMDFIKK